MLAWLNTFEPVLAIDTNIVVRLLTADDRRQTAKAQAILASGSVWVSLTVLLEAAWVLQSNYGLARPVVIDRLAAFAGLPMVVLQDTQAARQALTWAAHGMDFADALHLAQVRGCEAFLTFDKALARQADEFSPGPVVREP